MRARILVHLEASDSGPVWWAESPEFPGFSAAGDTLVNLRRRTNAALSELASERGELLQAVSELLAVDGGGSQGTEVESTDRGATEAASVIDAVTL